LYLVEFELGGLSSSSSGLGGLPASFFQCWGKLGGYLAGVSEPICPQNSLRAELAGKQSEVTWKAACQNTTSINLSYAEPTSDRVTSLEFCGEFFGKKQ